MKYLVKVGESRYLGRTGRHEPLRPVHREGALELNLRVNAEALARSFHKQEPAFATSVEEVEDGS